MKAITIDPKVISILEKHGLPTKKLDEKWRAALEELSQSLNCEKDIAEQSLESEAELRALITSTSLGLFLSDEKGTLSYVNSRFQEITGYASEEATQQDWSEHIHPDDRQDFLVKWHELQHQHINQLKADVRFVIFDRDTHTTKLNWGHINAAPININGKTKGFLGTIDDLNEKKRAESILEGEKQILEMMVRNSGQKIIIESILQLIVNQGHRLQACVCQFGPAGQVIFLGSINLAESFSINFNSLTIDRVKFSQAFGVNRQRPNQEVLIYNLSLDPMWAPLVHHAENYGFSQCYALPITDSHRQIVGAVLLFSIESYKPSLKQLEVIEFFNDLFSITIEKANLEENLLDEQMKLISSNKMASLGQMAGSIAHEIMNPLSIIDGFAVRMERMLKSGTVDSNIVGQSVQKIRTTVDRITKIINSLRNFARDGESDAYTPTKVKNIIEDTLEFCKQKIVFKKIDLKVGEIDPDLQIECQQVQISQIILNLISNSSDAIESLDRRWINIEVSNDNFTIMIRVTDSGPGIRSEIADKIMKPLFTTKPAGKGTGLGLSISKAIAESHNGKLLYDREAANTSFVLILPQKQVVSTVKAA